MNPAKAVTTLFMLAVTVGALTLFLKHPAQTNTVLASGVDLITGVTSGLQGPNVPGFNGSKGQNQ